MNNQDTAEKVRAVVILLEEIYQEGTLNQDEREFIAGAHALLEDADVFDRAADERRQKIVRNVKERAPNDANDDYLLGMCHYEDETITADDL